MKSTFAVTTLLPGTSWNFAVRKKLTYQLQADDAGSYKKLRQIERAKKTTDNAHVKVEIKKKKKCFVVLIRRELPSMFPVKSEEEKPNIPIDHKLDEIS